MRKEKMNIMKNSVRKSFILIGVLLLSVQAFSKENIGSNINKIKNNLIVVAAACERSNAKTDLEINNVRTTILTGGDMWWDLAAPKYEIPKGGGAHSLFAGSLWIGGIDAGGQLKVAAMTYRQGGNDFWPGPMDITTSSTDLETCQEYDKHFRIKRKDVEDFYAWYIDPSSNPNYAIPSSILDWPAHGDPVKNHAKYLAPFYDNDGDGYYDPNAGDYPDFNVRGSDDCNSQLFGDEALWWVFNDKGNIHTETNAQPIGLEIHAQAFGFATNDEINDMTFYNYKVINRSTIQLNDCYFGQWVDADVGFAFDDYVGCDVARGLGFCYNGTEVDGTGAPGQYGENPPAVGVDFFQGPLADPGDGIDNDRDGTVDEVGEQIIMSKFIYYKNDFSLQGNPVLASDFYGYLSGFWRDGSPFTYGGEAYQTGGVVCDFMFPGFSDPTGWGTGGLPQAPWDEVTAGTVPGDRRFMQSAGPFTLQPGAVNHVTTGVVWARATQGGVQASIALMKLADDKAQALFDNCFEVLNGPDAPDLSVQEIDGELIFYLSNRPTSNNYLESYEEKDPLIINLTDTTGVVEITDYDKTYNFEGYQVFQLKHGQVSATDLYNPDLARLVFQCDVKNGVTKLVNFDFDQALNANIPQEMVNGVDKGIVHSFKLQEDQFAEGDKALVNHKTYYYMAVAYGYNNFKNYDQQNALALDGQKKPYKSGRRNIRVVSAIPHKTEAENGGTKINAAYGFGPKITRIEGNGNGGNHLELTEASVTEILTNGKAIHPTYENAFGPVGVRVIDPLSVPDADFKLRFALDGGKLDTAKWVLTNITTGDSVVSETSIAMDNEQLIPEWGIALTIKQVPNVGAATSIDNGFIASAKMAKDPNNVWLTGQRDVDGATSMNWIRSGVNTVAPWGDYAGLDDKEIFEQVVEGTWAPYRMCGYTDARKVTIGQPAWEKFITLNKLEYVSSVDVVITADQSKWTRCLVLEMAEDPVLAEGNAKKLDKRKAPSVDKNGNPDGTGTGMGWFPGYAINVETGERLNMAFGEDSWLPAENGRDMLWNPTSSRLAIPSGQPLFGGKHFIYVFGHWGDNAYDLGSYDEAAILNSLMDDSNGAPPDLKKRNVFKQAMWVNIPLRAPGYEDLNLPFDIPMDIKFSIRMSKPYAKGYSTPGLGAATPQNNDYPLYTFNTSDIATGLNDGATAKDALDLINVVPNPYYGYSKYENSQLENFIKLTNLPEKCKIRIYSVNGTLIRTFDKDDPNTYLTWDLKNLSGISVASGLYIIHVDVDGVGEKILKWFGVLRPTDLDAF